MNRQNDAVDRALREAQSLLARGDMVGARQRCEAIVRVHPRSGIAHELFAIVEYQRGIYDHALALIERAISIEPRDADFLNSRGIILQTLGRLDDALASYDAAISIEPRRAQVWYNRGIVFNAAGRFDEALASYAKALEAQPNYPEALVNRGNVLQGLKRFDEALACYNAALTKNPNLPNALVNRGIALQALNQRAEALGSFDRALASQPHYADALLNRGIALESLGRPEEALRSYETAQKLEPSSNAILLKRGDVLQDLGRVDEAMNAYRSVIAAPIATNSEAALHDRVAVELLWCERKLCAWDSLCHDTDEAARSLRAGAATPNPFMSLLVFDDPEIQLDCARRYSIDCRRGSLKSVAKTPSTADRIRVGYLSGDLCDHATSYLLAGVFEAHDRSRFEICAYSYGPDDHSAMRARLLRSFDAFVDVRELSDTKLAERIAADQVHILIDLNGYTRRNRASVFEFRPAPICVHYLGYPSTLGSQDVDYLIADSYVIPQGVEKFFSEAVVRLPGCYQATDDRREIADLAGRVRRDAGLPAEGFVFCAFNRPYKITPEVFDVWMRILECTPGSVLWLLRDNDRVESNLRREATRRGIDGQRLVFAPRVAPAEHLARHQFADLFLDTWPVCAHTTASDSLWAGVPLLTHSGRTFIARVAGSLLTAIGMPELIAPSVAAYENTAIELARSPRALASLREKLAVNGRTQPLFDTKRFCRNLESAFEQMWSIAHRGERPRGFTVVERA